MLFWSDRRYHAGGCLVHEGVDEPLLGLGQEDLLVVGLGKELEEFEDILEEWESKCSKFGSDWARIKLWQEFKTEDNLNTVSASVVGFDSFKNK